MAPAGADAPPDAAPRQCYLEITQPRHGLLAGIADTEVVPAIGHHCVVEPLGSGAEVPLRLGAPFRVFPEGYAYPVEAASGCPMAIARASGGHRVVYFPFQIGTGFWRAGIEDLGSLMANSVLWAGSRPELEVQAPTTVHASLRARDDLRMVHLVNLTGGRRFFRQLVPIADVELGLRCRTAARAFCLSDGRPAAFVARAGMLWATLDRLADYEVVVFEGVVE